MFLSRNLRTRLDLIISSKQNESVASNASIGIRFFAEIR